METEKFSCYMKQSKKPAKSIQSYVRSLEFYADFLRANRQIDSPDGASPGDLTAFVNWGVQAGENVYRHLWGIRSYYEFIQRTTMEMKVREWMEYLQNETRKLGEFPKVDKNSVKKLSAVGIKTVNQLLRAGYSHEKQAALAEQSGAPEAAILDLFKLSNLSRLPGLKKVRARLFFEAGLDTLESIAALEPEEVHRILQEFVERTGFDASVPTPDEARLAITMSRFLPENIT